MTSAAEFQAKVTKNVTNMDRLDGIVNGGPSAVIETDNGPVPSMAKAIGDFQADVGDLSEAIDEVNAAAEQTAADRVQTGLDRIAAENAAATLPTSNAQNLWYDPFFKRLRAAYPTAAASMLLNGLRRVNMGGTAPVWAASDNKFGNRGLTSSVATTDYYTWLSEYGVPDGAQINEAVAIEAPTGTTFTITPVIQDAAFSTNLVIGSAVTVVGNGAIRTIPIAAITTPSDGSGKTLRLRVVRTVGSGTHTMHAIGMFQGAQQRPIAKVDLLGNVADNTTAVAPVPTLQSSLSAYQNPTATASADGSYVNASGVVTVGGATNRYARFALTGVPVRVSTILPSGTGYWLAIYYNASGTYLGREKQSANAGDETYTNYTLTPPPGAASVSINGRTTASVVLQSYSIVTDIAARVLGTASGGFVGKKAAALGDSITEMARWFSPLISYLGLSSINNNGIGGTTVSKPDVGSGAAMCDDARINAIPSDSKFILFMGGTNDWGQSRAIGTITNIGVTAFDNTTFIGALEQVAVKLLARFTDGQMIVWMVPIFGRNQSRVESGLWTSPYYNILGLGIEAYQDAVRLVAKKYGFPIIDLPARLGWNTQNAALFYDHEGTDTTTYIHPSATKGGPLMAAIMADEMARLNRAAALV